MSQENINMKLSRDDSKEEDSSDEMLFVEEYVSRDEDRNQLQDLFFSIGVSPIKSTWQAGICQSNQQQKEN